MDELLQATGVYVIACIPTGEAYVGCTMRSFDIRFAQHATLLECGNHHAAKLQERYDELGVDAFKVAVMVVSSDPKHAIREEMRLMREYHAEGKLLNGALISLPREGTVSIPVTLDKGVWNRLKAEAKRQGMQPPAFIARLVEEWTDAVE